MAKIEGIKSHKATKDGVMTIAAHVASFVVEECAFCCIAVQREELTLTMVYQNKKIIGTPIMQGKQLKTMYVMYVEEAYVDKARKNKTVDFWHARLGRVSYHKLNVIMMKSMLKRLP
ncbi:hypothetical protein ACH5RR_025408 [Cinchona calisaya]|uniref:Uncharacterized protein n=1 Tax=Cinchona calisaya TaxID=153742 RepID=A0ABD2YZK0_9GENT